MSQLKTPPPGLPDPTLSPPSASGSPPSFPSSGNPMQQGGGIAGLMGGQGPDVPIDKRDIIEPLEPVQGHDYIGLVNQISIWFARATKDFLKSNTRLLQMLPPEVLGQIEQSVGLIMEGLDVSEKVTRGIHKYPPFRNSCNGTIDYVCYKDEYDRRAKFYGLYQRWEQGFIPDWIELRKEYNTLYDALKESRKAVHQACCAWLGKNGGTELPAEDEKKVEAVAWSFLTLFTQRAEELDANILAVLDRKPVSHPGAGKKEEAIARLLKRVEEKAKEIG